MFTGIITHLGKISEKQAGKLTIRSNSSFLSKIKRGTSIAVNGICLTVVDKSESIFKVDYIAETDAKTNIKYLKRGALVNLELPATSESFLSGHIIQGHVDAVARLEDIKERDNSHILKFSMPDDLSKYIVSKGSISVNGISLTVIEANRNSFTVGIIPFTWNETMLHTINQGDFVNIEVDILAKYLEKLLK